MYDLHADVYRAAADRGIPSEVIDRTPVWKVGAMLRPAKTPEDETLEVFAAAMRGEDMERRAHGDATVIPLMKATRPEGDRA